MFIKFTRLNLAIIAFFSLSHASVAEDYPTRPITLAVAFPAGGPVDKTARIIMESMSKDLKQQVVVENINGGAGGTVGVAQIARATPDGYTILIHHIGQATASALYRNLPYDPVDDFEMIGMVAHAPMTLIARKDFPARNFQELVAYAQANPTKVTLANAGVGSASHLCGMLFASSARISPKIVSYKGTGPAMDDLLAGKIDLMCDQPSTAANHIRNRKLKVYAVTSKERVELLSYVPTTKELGMPDFEVTVWFALYAPKNTPKVVVYTLNKALKAALRDPQARMRFAEYNMVPLSTAQATPEYHRAFLRTQIAKWGPVIKTAGALPTEPGSASAVGLTR